MASPGPRMSQDTFGSPARLLASNQYPFPSQDASLRRGPLQRASTASSINGPPAIAESGPNAISTLLQSPIIRTGVRPTDGGFKPPTQRDIPPVTLTNIQHVDAKAFHPYLSQIGSLYEAFQRAKNETENGEPALFLRDKKEKEEDWEAVLSKKLQRPAHGRTGSTSSSIASPLERPGLSPRRSSGQRRQAVTPLSTVPSIYSEDDFHLENPRTFDIVSERSEIVCDPNAAPSGRKSLATNAILQEKLSWYLDTVEVHLISSISTASKSFFSALGSLRELHDEAEESVVRIQRLRKVLAKIDKEMASDGLKIVKLKQRRDNIRRLAEAMLQLEDVVVAIDHCESMIEAGEIDDALNDLDSIEGLIAGEQGNSGKTDGSARSHKPQDLRRLNALGGALDGLNQLRLRVGKGYEGRFHGCLLGDVRKHVGETDMSVTLQRWATAFNRPKPGQRRTQSVFPSYMNISPDLRTDLDRAMQGLARARYTTPAVTSFRAAILREIKSMIRKQLPSATDDDNVSTVSASTHGGRGLSQQEKSSILARNLRALDPEDWFQTLTKVYTSISECLRRLSVQTKILLDVTSTIDQSRLDRAKSPPPTANQSLSPATGRNRARSIQAEMQQALDLSSLLGEAVDVAQIQITKVVKVRSQQNHDMSLREFIRFFTLNRLFADECEAISGRSGQSLKSVIDAQVKDFVVQFGSTQRQRLVEIMDRDKWEARDFGEAENAILSRVVEGSTQDAPAWLESSQIWNQPAQPSTNGTKTTSTNGEAGTPSNATAAKEKIRSAVLDEQKYILPESPIAMLRSAESFQHLTSGIPGMGQELANSLLDCLRQFNSRTSQLILGAGATRTAGLKNITTKYLALSSQGLGFIVALVPYVREYFRRYVPSGNAAQTMAEFDKVKRALQEHQNSIHEKLVDIMSGRAGAHVRDMKSVNWEEVSREPPAQGGVSRYMEMLIKETTTLHKVLAKHLPEGVVLGVMVPVFDSYRTQWEEAYKSVELRSVAAKERMLVDVETFNARMSKLDGVGNLGTHLVNVVKAKPIVNASQSGAGGGGAAAAPAEGSKKDESRNDTRENPDGGRKEGEPRANTAAATSEQTVS